MGGAAVWRVLAALLVFATACKPAEEKVVVARGKGLEVVTLAPATEPAVYDAAIRAAFDVGPGLALYLHPRRLPRTAGTAGGEAISPGLAQKLRASGLVQGTCDPKRDTPAASPRCDAPEAGYIIRLSDVLRVTTDTLEVYFAAERFATLTGAKQPPFHFEKIFQLAREGSRWRVVREGRVTEDRGE